MRLTKYTHSCVRLEDRDRSLVIDPGTFSESEEAISGCSAILVTHEHVDHVDEDAINAAMRADSELRMWAPNSVAPAFHEYGERVTTVNPGQTFEVCGFHVTTHGGQHAVIHPHIPVVKNVGYVINELVYHPGDSFIVPNVPVPNLLLPLHAPWSKFAEVADFLISVRPQRAFQIHDALLSEIGLNIVEKNLERITAGYGAKYQHLAPRESVEI